MQLEDMNQYIKVPFWWAVDWICYIKNPEEGDKVILRCIKT